MKQLTFLLQNPHLLFRLLFSFQRPSRRCDRPCTLPEPDQPVKNFFSDFFEAVSRHRRQHKPETKGLQSKLLTNNRLPTSVRLYSVAKSCAAKSNFIAKTFSSVNAFFFRGRRRSAPGAPRSSAECGYSKWFPERQRVYCLFLPMDGVRHLTCPTTGFLWT